MKKLMMMLGWAAILAAPMTARADEEPQNLSVLDKSIGKDLGKGMKDLTKGLGVKCEACHVKGKMEADDVAAKEITRTFFKAALDADAATREKALEPVLAALKLKAAKDKTKIHSGLDFLKSKKK